MTCAFAVRGAIKKFPGVESVDVSLNKGLATVRLKPGNTMKPEDFWETIRRNGYTSKETSVVVRGDIEGKKLKVTGTSQFFDLAPDLKSPRVLEEAGARTSKTVTVRGTLTPQKDLKAPIPLRVRSIENGR